MSFEVGDKVKRIAHCRRIRVGKICTVDGVDQYGNWISVEEYPTEDPDDTYPWCARNFELVEKARDKADDEALLEADRRRAAMQQDIQLEDPPEDNKPIYDDDDDRGKHFLLECLYCGESYKISDHEATGYLQCKYCTETKLLKVSDQRQKKGDVFGYQCQG